MTCRIAANVEPVHHCANDGRPFLPMRNPLAWLLALLLCWQTLAAATGPATMPQDHTPVAAHSGDCGHAMPGHCPESRHQAATAETCATHCPHCPGSVACLPAPSALSPAPIASTPPSLARAPLPARPPTLIYRPPIAA